MKQIKEIIEIENALEELKKIAGNSNIDELSNECLMLAKELGCTFSEAVGSYVAKVEKGECL